MRMSAALLASAEAGSAADAGSITAERLSDWDKLVSVTRSAGATAAQHRPAQPDQPQLPSTRAACFALSPSPPRLLPAQPQPPAASTASSSSSASSSPAAAAASVSEDAVVDRLSGFRIRDRLQCAAEAERRLRGVQTVRLDNLERWWKDADSGRGSAQADWCLFCVLVSQSDIRSTAKGSGRYVIATLTDLQGRLLSCFLFDSAFTALRQQEVGGVLAITNAKLSAVPAAAAASAASSSAFLSVSLSVSNAAQLLVLGQAADFAFCSAYKREAHTAADAPPSASMTRCRNVVDVSRSSYCDYHIAAEYRKVAGERVGLNRGGVGGERAGLIHFGPAAAAAAAGRSFGQRRGFRGGWGRTAERDSGDVVYLLPPEKPTAGTMPAATREKILAGLRAEQQRRRAETKPSLAAILLAATPTQPHSSSDSSWLRQSETATSASTASAQAAARSPARSTRPSSASAALARPAAAASSSAAAAETTSRKRKRAEASSSSGHADLSSSAPVSLSCPSSEHVKCSALQTLFGAVDLSSPAGQRLLSASSAHLALLADMRADEREEYWAFLAHKHSRLLQTGTMLQRKTAGADSIQ